MDAKDSLGQPRLLISRSALRHNARLIRRYLAPSTRICAMVKADAYGHGAPIVVDALCNFADQHGSDPLVDALAVATIDEAAQLPSTALPVLILRPTENVFLGRQRDAIEAACLNGWMVTLSTASAADDVARIALNCGRRLGIHVMVDTGMTRCGVDLNLLPNLLQRIESLPSLRLMGLCTHLASSEVPDHTYTDEQLARFAQATDEHHRHNPRLIRHAANSGGIFFHPRSHYDMVRPGISLYGIDPTCRPSFERALKPVMKWTAPLVAIHNIRAGTTVGYNQTWTAPRDTRIGLVPVGYADGYMRSLSNRGVMMLDNTPLPVVGRVSMDLTTIDLFDCPEARIGDEVTVLDNDPLSPASVYRLAESAGTIPYELFTRIGSRVRRVGVDPCDEEFPLAEELTDGLADV